MLVEGQADELRRRIGVVLSRTLRRQAQEFLSKPFVSRQSRLFEYHMAAEERVFCVWIPTGKLLDEFRTARRSMMREHFATWPAEERETLLRLLKKAFVPTA